MARAGAQTGGGERGHGATEDGGLRQARRPGARGGLRRAAAVLQQLPKRSGAAARPVATDAAAAPPILGTRADTVVHSCRSYAPPCAAPPAPLRRVVPPAPALLRTRHRARPPRALQPFRSARDIPRAHAVSPTRAYVPASNVRLP